MRFIIANTMSCTSFAILVADIEEEVAPSVNGHPCLDAGPAEYFFFPLKCLARL